MNRQLFRTALILNMFLLCTARMAAAQDWPQWRGRNQDGISRETGWDPNTLKNESRILWRADAGQGHSGVAIQEGLIYTQGSRFTEKNGDTAYEETVICLDAGTGEMIWDYAYPAEPMAHAGPRATPAISGDRVYTLGSEGHLFCFNRKTGAVLWQKDLVAENLSGTCKWGFSASPVIEGDALLLNVGSAGLALNAESGELIWKSGIPSWGLPSPVLCDIGGRRAMLLNTEYTLYAVSVSDGKQLWSYRWPYGDADPLLIGDRVYLFGGKPGNARCRALVNLRDGSQAAMWEQRRMNVAFQSPVYRDGCVYGLAWDKKNHHLYCFDIEGGKLRWEKKLDDWAGMSMAGEYLILLEAGGDLVIAEANPQGYSEVSRAAVLDMNRESSDDQPLTCWTAPVLCGGKIYVRNTYGEIACVDVRR